MEREAQLFPTLSPAQVDRIRAVGRPLTVPAGEVLIELGEQNTRFFVVIRGGIEIVLPMGDRRERRSSCMGPGEFTGEINMLSARRSLVRARRESPTRGHRRSIATSCAPWCSGDSELSEILMRAFILRRVALIGTGQRGPGAAGLAPLGGDAAV